MVIYGGWQLCQADTYSEIAIPGKVSLTNRSSKSAAAIIRVRVLAFIFSALFSIRADLSNNDTDNEIAGVGISGLRLREGAQYA
jgi:hypothetical protein